MLESKSGANLAARFLIILRRYVGKSLLLRAAVAPPRRELSNNGLKGFPPFYDGGLEPWQAAKRRGVQCKLRETRGHSVTCKQASLWSSKTLLNEGRGRDGKFRYWSIKSKAEVSKWRWSQKQQTSWKRSLRAGLVPLSLTSVKHTWALWMETQSSTSQVVLEQFKEQQNEETVFSHTHLKDLCFSTFWDWFITGGPDLVHMLSLHLQQAELQTLSALQVHHMLLPFHPLPISVSLGIFNPSIWVKLDPNSVWVNVDPNRI